VREQGLEEAIRAAGGVGALARALGLSQPSVSNWRRVPSERVVAVEAATGISRHALRPDLYRSEFQSLNDDVPMDDIDRARADLYDLLAALLGRSPDEALLERVAGLKGETTDLGIAMMALADLAERLEPRVVSREYFNLFIGVGRGELLPYGSYYLTGFLHERPLAAVRDDLQRLGIERSEDVREPEDHVGILCEIMAGLIRGQLGDAGEQQAFFEKHLKPWAARFFADLEAASGAEFYRPVGSIGRLFMEIEAEAFTLPM